MKITLQQRLDAAVERNKQLFEEKGALEIARNNEVKAGLMLREELARKDARILELRTENDLLAERVRAGDDWHAVAVALAKRVHA